MADAGTPSIVAEGVQRLVAVELRNYPVPEPPTLDKVYLLPEKARVDGDIVTQNR